MGIEEKLPSGVLLTTVEGVAGYMRKASFWPATFGLACCAIEMMTTGGPKYDLARFGMEVFRASPRQADLMIVAGRVSQKMAPVLRQIYDQMAEPKWVLAMGVCASTGGMFNNYAIVQGVDHVVPVDMYLPGCPPRPEMLIDAILKLHDQVQTGKLGANRRAADRGARDHRPHRAADLRDAGPAAMSDDEKDPRPVAQPDGRARVARTGQHSPPADHATAGEVPARGASARAAACSASAGTGDTSGYGGLVRRSSTPARPSAPTAAGSTTSPTPSRRGWTTGSMPRSSGSWSTAARSPSTSAARTSSRVAQLLRDDPAAALRVLLRRQRRALPRRHRARAARGLPPALDDPQPPDPRRGHRPDADPHIPSIVAVYPTNDWHERETYDMFGIVFDGHPALTRILMPDDWPGHPQRKDYPLGGIPVEYKGGTIPPPDQRRSYN